MDYFESLSEVNDLIESGREADARDSLIHLLDAIKKRREQYSPPLNHLIRKVGLFPYLKEESSHWEDRLVLEAFKADVGDVSTKPLHREQSLLLSKLVAGESVAVSAPTSFGKSFVIDAFIAISAPKSVLIIVPTIALMDEARRRLQRKFGATYQIITTTDASEPQERVIYIFPQERAIAYSSRIKDLDLLVVDEFYKASPGFDKARSPSLIRAILRFSKIAKQRYFLAPNISELKENPLTKGMEFLKLDFNTVALRVHDLSPQLDSIESKSQALKDLLADQAKKCLIYAGSHAQVKLIAGVLENSLKGRGSLLLADFSDWLKANYSDDWLLARLVQKGVGLHNGQLHRALSQIQVRMFDEVDGINVLVSTSSIIEGVNTSAERVIVWNNKNGSSKLTPFDYKNILGRSGRMFRHFVGDVYVLEQPPAVQDQQLDLALPDALFGMEEVDHLREEFSESQRVAADKYVADFDEIFEFAAVRKMQSDGLLQTSNSSQIAKMFKEARNNSQSWRGLAFLNSDDVRKWDGALYLAINLDSAGWESKFRDVVAFVKVASSGWSRTIPQQLRLLHKDGIDISDYFRLERAMSFRLSSLLGDMNAIHARLNPHRGFDISKFVFRMSHAFLPPVVYQLEELGLPRMISRKIHDAKFIDLTSEDVTLSTAVNSIKRDALEIERAVLLGVFERYVFEYFIEGVSSSEPGLG
ncbi:hypothetical protein LL963_02425 [Xanthomonas campestris pv. esculenti]|nr:hypothetical protein [Xanthomonas campestris pv. esculenti]